MKCCMGCFLCWLLFGVVKWLWGWFVVLGKWGGMIVVGIIKF